MDREALEERDPAAPVAHLEADRARALPLAAGVGLDDEAAELLRLGERAVDLVEQVAAIAGARQERLHLLVTEQVDEEVDVLPLRAPYPDPARLDHGAVRRAARRLRLSAIPPEPSATPRRISTSPAIADQRTGSPRIVEP